MFARFSLQKPYLSDVRFGKLKKDLYQPCADKEEKGLPYSVIILITMLMKVPLKLTLCKIITRFANEIYFQLFSLEMILPSLSECECVTV